MANLPASTVIQVNVTKQQSIKSLEDFGLVCVFTENTLVAPGTYAIYDSVQSFDEVFTTPSSLKVYGDTFFAQSLTPNKLMVARVNTPTEDYATVIETVSQQEDFYAVAIDELELDSATMLEIGEKIQELQLIWLQARGVSDIKTLYTTFQGSNLTRCALILIDDGSVYTNRPDAGLYGVVLTKTAGSTSWSNKTLTNVTTTTQSNVIVNDLIDTGVNVYTDVATAKMTMPGNTAAVDPTFLDQIQGMDWLRIGIQEDIISLINSVNKIPYDDAGCQQIASVIQARGALAQQLRILNPSFPWTVNVPITANATIEDRQLRRLPSFSCVGQLAEAVNMIIVNAFVEI